MNNRGYPTPKDDASTNPRTDRNRIRKPTYTRYDKSSDRRNALAANATLYLHAHATKGTQITKTESNGSSVARATSTLNQNPMEWNPKHFRLFVGNLGGDANDALLANAFQHFPSVSKVKVPMDPATGKNRGYGFVAFSNADDYLQAFQEMNGAYIGQRPVQLKRADPLKKPSKTKGGRGR